MAEPSPNRTPLFDAHREAGAKMVDFHGWEMPIHYGSQIEEHHAVRRDAGVFDVSHMTVVDVHGAGAEGGLRYLLVNDVARLDHGRALYTAMCNDSGGIIDDLIVYRRGDDFRMVVNAATREDDLAWMQARLEGFDLTVTERPELAMIAVQGPHAIERARTVMRPACAEVASSVGPFEAGEVEGWFIGRTGYTGEDGLELMLPGEEAPAFWGALLAAGATPAGLGARDTLRLEAGLNLYGQDMDTGVTPLESNIGWTVAWKPAERAFVGRAALERQRAEGVARRLIGVVLEGKGVLRAGQEVLAEGERVGALTSGAYAPTLACGIGLARLDAAAAAPGRSVAVRMRGREQPAHLVKPPFVRNGEKVFE